MADLKKKSGIPKPGGKFPKAKTGGAAPPVPAPGFMQKAPPVGTRAAGPANVNVQTEAGPKGPAAPKPFQTPSASVPGGKPVTGPAGTYTPPPAAAAPPAGITGFTSKDPATGGLPPTPGVAGIGSATSKDPSMAPPPIPPGGASGITSFTSNDPAGPPPPANGPTPLTTDQVVANQLGTNNPFGMRGNYTDPNNPIFDAARQNMQRELAARGSQLSAGGMGNSTYAAQMGADTLSNFGAQVGQIGEQAYQNDASRNLQAALGAQNLNLGAQGLQMQGQNALGQLGQALNAIGAGEQSPQNLQAILSLLGLTMGQTGQGGYGSTDVGGGYGTYNY